MGCGWDSNWYSVWWPAQLQGDGHCTMSAYKSREAEGCSPSPAGLPGTLETLQICKNQVGRRTEGDPIWATTGGGRVFKNPDRKQKERPTPVPLESAWEQCPEMKRTNMCFPSRWRHLGPNHQVNKSSKTHITPGKEPNREVIPLAPGREIKACSKLHC